LPINTTIVATGHAGNSSFVNIPYLHKIDWFKNECYIQIIM
jgi:hypothetical protein